MAAGPALAEPRLASWAFAEGEEIVPGRHAVDLLGGGERSQAWLAWDDRLHTLVVAKLLRPDQVDDTNALAGLEREARALSLLNHPSIVRCFGALLDGPRPHLVLESLDGPRLSTLLRRFGPLAPEQIVPLAIEIASALAFMHDAGYLHLDVKPRNLIMGASPKLIDLGIARTIGEAAHLTSPLGTDAYMAPEQTWAETVGSVGPHTDVWGLAVTLYEAMERRLPFQESDAAPGERYPQRTARPAPFQRQTIEPIASVIMSGLARDPLTRPSMTDIAAALEPLVPGARGTARRRLRRRVR